MDLPTSAKPEAKGKEVLPHIPSAEALRGDLRRGNSKPRAIMVARVLSGERQ